MILLEVEELLAEGDVALEAEWVVIGAELG